MEVEGTATGEKSTGAWATGTEQGWAGAAESPSLIPPHTAQAHMYLHLGLPELSTASHHLDFPHVLSFAWNAFPSHPMQTQLRCLLLQEASPAPISCSFTSHSHSGDTFLSYLLQTKHLSPSLSIPLLDSTPQGQPVPPPCHVAAPN